MNRLLIAVSLALVGTVLAKPMQDANKHLSAEKRQLLEKILTELRTLDTRDDGEEEPPAFQWSDDMCLTAQDIDDIGNHYGAAFDAASAEIDLSEDDVDKKRAFENRDEVKEIVEDAFGRIETMAEHIPVCPEATPLTCDELQKNVGEVGDAMLRIVEGAMDRLDVDVEKAGELKAVLEDDTYPGERIEQVGAALSAGYNAYVAMAAGAEEAIWLQSVLNDLQDAVNSFGIQSPLLEHITDRVAEHIDDLGEDMISLKRVGRLLLTTANTFGNVNEFISGHHACAPE